MRVFITFEGRVTSQKLKHKLLDPLTLSSKPPADKTVKNVSHDVYTVVQHAVFEILSWSSAEHFDVLIEMNGNHNCQQWQEINYLSVTIDLSIPTAFNSFAIRIKITLSNCQASSPYCCQ